MISFFSNLGTPCTSKPNKIGAAIQKTPVYPEFAQNLGKSDEPRLKLPKVIRHRKAEVIIYGKRPNYPYYRSDGKRQMRHFSNYSDAFQEAQKKARQIAGGHPSVALTFLQSRDAATAFELLEPLRKQGSQVTLVPAISEYIEASKN